ncbi:MAG: threonylcarbamoyl-AMP synthase [Bacteroidales bacterium]|jgi:tRNA threonylcarbamoyl adenosine modification protein (Sua5/YciO/YrdC/YwlC family)|nr:threonylcarbamoyl-AMP synthase [Bacteroidales bacterium]
MIIKLYEENPNPRQVNQIVESLAAGGLVIIPTDTVYGIACSLSNVQAIETLAEIRSKKVKEANFSVMCHDISQISEITKPLSTQTFKLLKRNLPGPFTFILEANNKLTKLLKFSRKSVGVRIPNNNIALEIIRALNEPLVITSVKNDDDDIIEYITDPELIHDNYKDIVAYVVDGGIGNNEGSTVVDCTADEPVVVRQGEKELLL